eukprot:TRINITY_DN2262_c0_g1_i4.p1 TRINITY_DN2262_c0_g1~~TRINITY_DN2262_c0_g1_i4.p1  ORF type:complete len:663 (-),score=108.24 TRINITY_DN2262_c0_g1_i4:135-2123(-)
MGGSDVTVRQVSVSGAPSVALQAVYIANCLNYNVFTNNYIGTTQNNFGNGVTILNSDQFDITFNTIVNSDGWGVYIDQTANSFSFSGTHIWIGTNTITNNNGGGVYLLNAVGVNVSQNSIQYNQNVGLAFSQTTAFPGNGFTVGIETIGQSISCNPDCLNPKLPVDIQYDGMITDPLPYPPADNLNFIEAPTIGGLHLLDPSPVAGSSWEVTVILPAGLYPPNWSYLLSIYVSSQSSSVVTGDGQTVLIDSYPIMTDSQGGAVVVVNVFQPEAQPLDTLCVSGQLWTFYGILYSGPIFYPSVSELSYCQYYVPPSKTATPSMTLTNTPTSTTSPSIGSSEALASVSVSKQSGQKSPTKTATTILTSGTTGGHQCQVICKDKNNRCVSNAGECVAGDVKRDDSRIINSINDETCCDIEHYEYRVSKEDHKRNFTLPVITTHGIWVGSVTIPKGTFPAGSYIDVGPAQRQPESVGGNDSPCVLDSNRPPLLGSAAFELGVHGAPSSGFHPPIKIDMLSKDLGDDYCAASAEGHKPWKCQDDYSSQRLDHKTHLVSTDTSHFTTFAVLFINTEPVGCSWIWIACLIAVAAMLFCMITVILLGVYHPQGRYIVYGYDEHQSIQKLMNKIPKLETSASELNLNAQVDTSSSQKPSLYKTVSSLFNRG